MNYSPFFFGIWLAPVLPNSSVCEASSQVYYLPTNDLSFDEEQRESLTEHPKTEDKGTSIRRTWTPEEDAKLIEVMADLQNKSPGIKIPFRIVAKHFEGRTSKQIRERYINKLDPKIIHQPFTSEEDASICEYYLKKGPQWKALSIALRGRTPTMIKNRFNTKLKSIIQSYAKGSSDQKPDTTDWELKLPKMQ